MIHQALDQAQALHLVCGVEALAVDVAIRHGKAVAAFPDAENIL